MAMENYGMDEPHITDHAIDKFIKLHTYTRIQARKALLKLFSKADKVQIPPEKAVVRLINNAKEQDFKDVEAEYYEISGFRMVIVNGTMVTFEKKDY